MNDLAPGAGPQEKMRTIENLANYNRDHEESHVAIAKSALAAGMWQEAREHLEAVSVSNPSARICRYMAELVEAEGGDSKTSREWLRRASITDPDPAWVCDGCGNTVAEWEPICGQCEKFDILKWKTPPRVTVIENTGAGINYTKDLNALSVSATDNKNSNEIPAK